MVEPFFDWPNTRRRVLLCSLPPCLCLSFHQWSVISHMGSPTILVPQRMHPSSRHCFCQHRKYTVWQAMVIFYQMSKLLYCTSLRDSNKKHCLRGIHIEAGAYSRSNQLSASAFAMSLLSLHIAVLVRLCESPVVYPSWGHGQDAMALTEQAHQTFRVYTYHKEVSIGTLQWDFLYNPMWEHCIDTLERRVTEDSHKGSH